MTISVTRVQPDGTVDDLDLPTGSEAITLAALQDAVGCRWVEAFIAAGIVVWGDEEAMMKADPVVNSKGTAVVAWLAATERRQMAQHLYGNLVFTGRDGGRTVSLSREQRVVLARAILYAEVKA